MTDEGYIQPDPEYIRDMFSGNRGCPYSMYVCRMEKVPYWNTFYQKVKYPNIDAQDLIRAMDIQYALADKLAETSIQAVSEGRNHPRSTSANLTVIKKMSSICSNPGENISDKWT